MPIYEYQCNKCNHTFEQLQLQSDASPQSCPKCGDTVEKLMSAGAYAMKSGSHAQQSTCCGHQTPCDSPKGCCGMGP